MSASCDLHGDAILEHALGEAASAELQAHLLDCDACRAALAREQRLVGTIDGELRQALAVEPCPEFLPRVRERAAAESERHSAPWLRWLGPLAAAAATLAFVAWLGQPTDTPTAVAPATARVEPRREVPEPPPAVVAEAPVARTPNALPQPVRTRRAPQSERLEVLVPQGEEELLRRYAAAVRARRIEAPPVGAEDPRSPELVVPMLLQIAPLAVAPLTDVNPEGVDHE